MRVSTGVSPQSVGQAAQRILYVEGTPNGLDPTVLSELVGELGWRVEALGPSHDLRAVARALHQTHPSYYFIIDRDHYSQQEVDQSWADFPNPDKHNLLIWRRRELENYFLDAEFLAQSSYLRQGWDQASLAERIRALVQTRIYMDCANLIIAALREEQKANWVKAFDNPAGLATAEAARTALLSRPEWQQRGQDVTNTTAPPKLAERFDQLVVEALGGAPSAEQGRGRWLDLVAGKEVFHAVANEAFLVKDANTGRQIQGAPARKLLARQLLKANGVLPGDFVQVRNLLPKPSLSI